LIDAIKGDQNRRQSTIIGDQQSAQSKAINSRFLTRLEKAAGSE
jgi:hypothetical protein